MFIFPINWYTPWGQSCLLSFQHLYPLIQSLEHGQAFKYGFREWMNKDMSELKSIKWEGTLGKLWFRNSSTISEEGLVTLVATGIVAWELLKPREEKVTELGVTGRKAPLASDSMIKSNERNYRVTRSVYTLRICLLHRFEIWDPLSLSWRPAMSALYWL